MRLPHPQIYELGFLADNAQEIVRLMGEFCDSRESHLIHKYFGTGLPPVTSIGALSVMFGYNPGFVWSLLNRTGRYYNSFFVPKGVGRRKITAPRVGLKVVQKWLAVHFSEQWNSPSEVFGFVPGKSHVLAAFQHLGAKWVVSVDISDFFPSVSRRRVRSALCTLGYNDEFSLNSIVALTCYGSGLAQGAPSSPVISNIVLSKLDYNLAELASRHRSTFTRYADDIVFSGDTDIPRNLVADICETIGDDGWVVSERKKFVMRYPGRLKVHGLLVHGNKLRLTKGYRNRLRAYDHLLKVGRVRREDIAMFRGHLEYARSIERIDEQDP